jgi:hypothetical protein
VGYEADGFIDRKLLPMGEMAGALILCGELTPVKVIHTAADFNCAKEVPHSRSHLPQDFVPAS